MNAPPHRKHVLLLIEASSAYARGCLCGIARYSNHTSWIIHHVARATSTVDELSLLNSVKPDGVIARIETAEVGKALRARRLPTVAILSSAPADAFCSVATDNRRVVEIGVEHLLGNGLTQLAYCGQPGRVFSDDRERAFESLATPKQIEKFVFRPEKWRDKNPDPIVPLVKWLRSLPKPVGVLACHDTRAREILQASSIAGFHVPDEVAVVGVDNDEVVCELSNPPLTSVVPNVESIGFRAATMLEELMAGKTPAERAVVVPPLGIEVRKSSDVIARGDAVVTRAVQYIRDNLSRGINVKELIAHAGVSRSTLERRFLVQLGCTPHDYIRGRQIERLRRLLLDTTYPISGLANMVGFRSSAHMIAVFKSMTSMTPGEFRRNAG